MLKAGDHRPFDQIVADFASSFPPPRQFSACICLALILDGKLLKPAQRLVAYAILQQVYSSQEPSSNPFISLLVNAACDEEAERCERAFILQLLGSASSTSSREVLKQSATDYMKMFDPSQHVSDQYSHIIFFITGGYMYGNLSSFISILNFTSLSPNESSCNSNMVAKLYQNSFIACSGTVT